MKDQATEKPIVAIKSGKRWNARQIIKETFDLLGGAEKFVKTGDTVVLKPNLGYPAAEGLPAWTCTTDHRVLSAITEILVEAGAKRVITADGPAHGITGAYMLEATGIKEAVEKVGGEVLGLDDDEFLLTPVPGGVILKEQWLPRSCLEADVFINVPKVKPTRVGRFTLGYKNLFGLVPYDERLPWHRIPEHFYFLADLYKAIPTTLTIMDGLVIQEGLGPRLGDPVDWGVLIAGENPVATEAVTLLAIGHEPYEQTVLPIAEKAGQGPMDIDQIEVKGDSIDSVKRYCKVSPGDYWLHSSPNVTEYCGGACWGCGLWIQYTPYPWEIDKNKKYALVVGVEPHLPDAFDADEVLVLGNCAARSKKKIESACKAKGITPEFIGGCPPYTHNRVKNGYFKAHKIDKLPHLSGIKRVES
ncbi:MAG: DUF362 domain-containing protein [Desulfobacterales bacterium]|nr:DUF362 domain-containing protein [Desulfobacterales bacterium]